MSEWIDEEKWYNKRVIESIINTDKKDKQRDVIEKEVWPPIMRWLNKHGFYTYMHTDFPIGDFIGYKFNDDGYPMMKIGIHDSATSGIPQHDEVWSMMKEYFDQNGNWGQSSIRGTPIEGAFKELSDGGIQVPEGGLGVWAVGWVEGDAASIGADVTSGNYYAKSDNGGEVTEYIIVPNKDGDIQKKIVRDGDKYCVTDEAGNKIACHNSREQAEKQLRAIEINKIISHIDKYPEQTIDHIITKCIHAQSIVSKYVEMGNTESDAVYLLKRRIKEAEDMEKEELQKQYDVLQKKYEELEKKYNIKKQEEEPAPEEDGGGGVTPEEIAELKEGQEKLAEAIIAIVEEVPAAPEEAGVQAAGVIEGGEYAEEMEKKLAEKDAEIKKLEEQVDAINKKLNIPITQKRNQQTGDPTPKNQLTGMVDGLRKGDTTAYKAMIRTRR